MSTLLGTVVSETGAAGSIARAVAQEAGVLIARIIVVAAEAEAVAEAGAEAHTAAVAATHTADLWFGLLLRFGQVVQSNASRPLNVHREWALACVRN